MAWQIVKQPNDKLARWSDVVDSLTHTNCEQKDMIALCIERYGMTQEEAEVKVGAAHKNPNRWEECVAEIKRVHGKGMADSFVEECSHRRV